MATRAVLENREFARSDSDSWGRFLPGLGGCRCLRCVGGASGFVKPLDSLERGEDAARMGVLSVEAIRMVN
jgi:hypothetical protein